MTDDRHRLPGDRNERRRFWTSVLIDTANELRAELRIDEASYQLIAATAFGSNSRDYVFYAALDEISKTAISILHWDELISGDPPTGHPSDPIDRLILAEARDSQEARRRKLVEILIDLICFATTNEPAYYRHYLLLRELRALHGTKLDLDQFYACPSRNLASSIDRVSAEVAELEAGGHIDLASCWYRPRGQAMTAADAARRHPNNLSTFTRARFRHALPQASPNEALVLGFSYDPLYGQASRAIHFTPRSPEHRLGFARVAGASEECALLGLHIVIRIQSLLGVVPQGRNRFLRDIWDNNETPRALVQERTRGMADVGDFVLACGDLGEVIEVAESEFGYRSYHVLYLAERPLPEIEDDWFPASEVVVLFSHAKTVTMVEARKDLPSNLQEQLRTPGNQHLRASMKELWERALRDSVQSRPTSDLPSDPSEVER